MNRDSGIAPSRVARMRTCSLALLARNHQHRCRRRRERARRAGAAACSCRSRGRRRRARASPAPTRRRARDRARPSRRCARSTSRRSTSASGRGAVVAISPSWRGAQRARPRAGHFRSTSSPPAPRPRCSRRRTSRAASEPARLVVAAGGAEEVGLGRLGHGSLARALVHGERGQRHRNLPRNFTTGAKGRIARVGAGSVF